MSVATRLVRHQVTGLAAVVLLGCSAPSIQSASSRGGAGGTGGASGSVGAGGSAGGAGGAAPVGPGTGSPIPDGGGAAPVSMPGDQKCAEDVHQAERIPVDLLLLVDTSGSMNNMAGMRTKWALVHDALVGFVKDPKSAGLGVGLQFFPLTAKAACTSDAECGGPTAFGSPSCLARRVCVGPTMPAGMAPPACSPLPGLFPERCATGTKCVDVGRCALSGADCFATGQPCPGGMAGNVCQPGPRSCFSVGASCAPADYQNVAVSVGALPGAEMSLVQSLDAIRPNGGTPTGPAVEGALAHARMHQMANPTHRVALVLATDGVPADCMPMDAAGISALVGAAGAASPSISTYVIGVFTPAEAPMASPLLQQLATAGGTGMPFVLTAGDDLGQRFQEALDKIRGSALPCEFMIPAPSGGGAIDFGKLNVRWKGASGEEDIPYVGSVDRCDPMRGGWYYDVPPAMGTPGRVLVCPASCNRFKADGTANVSLVFGCKTRVIE
jgi:hypothetical protein